jgi:hypothetical protein
MRGQAFLDFIINWVNNPASEHGLVLFGQAWVKLNSVREEYQHAIGTHSEQTCGE